MDEGRGKNGDKGERGETRESFASGNGDSGHREGRAGEGKRREFSNRRRTKIICGIRFPRGNRVSIGSCEIPGVLTRAIYHARSVFAYVVKGPCVAYALGHIGVVECLLKFACLRIRARTHPFSLSLSHPSAYLRISLFQPPRLRLATLVAKNPRRLSSSSSSSNFPSSHLTLFPAYRGSPSRSFVVSRLFRRDYSLPFPSSPCNVRIVKGDRIVRCAVFESRNECILGAREEGFVVVRGKRCAIYEPTVYIYIRICGEEVGSPRGRGT